MLLLAQFSSGQPTLAKLGDSIEMFKQKMAVNFKLISQEKKEQKAYYHFSVITDSKIQQASAGFGGGLTITTDSGKISGESLLVTMGSDLDIGVKLAAVLCLNLAYDALAKPIPSDSKDQEAELAAYTKAVKDAIANQPGHINYSGYRSQLIFSQTKEGNLLFVINSGSADTISLPKKNNSPAKH